jgi:hypothetical protein
MLIPTICDYAPSSIVFTQYDRDLLHAASLLIGAEITCSHNTLLPAGLCVIYTPLIAETLKVSG